MTAGLESVSGALGGPVSAALEAEVRAAVRRHGIVVWLDLDDHYSGFVDGLMRERAAGGLPYAVCAYRGSFLALLLALDADSGLSESGFGGPERAPLLVHLPGFNEESVRATPLLELYEAGMRFRKALPTLVDDAALGRIPRERAAAFLGAAELTLAGADAWLAAALDAHSGELAVLLRSLTLPALIDDLFAAGAVADRLDDPGDRSALWEHLRAATGMPADWRETFAAVAGAKADDAGFVTAGWALCVEYVHDLRRPPLDARLTPATAVPAPLVQVCRDLATHLRARYPVFYAGLADDTAGWLVEEAGQALAEDLGRTDTFRFEEEVILTAALAALAAGRWAAVLEWADARIDGMSFWLQGEPGRSAAWRLVEAAARLGAAIEAAGPSLAPAASLEAAVARYAEAGCAVDQAHRHLEQRRMALLYSQVPRFDVIRERIDAVAERWRAWADAWALDFNTLCLREGFLPEPGLAQRTLFREVVEPLTAAGAPAVLFLVDALRYEMGEELFRLLKDLPTTRVTLAARLAELPTVTAVGMNALAPVAVNARLRPVIADGQVRGFAAGELNVCGPEDRKQAMHGRVGGERAPWLSLEEVLTRGESALKQTLARAHLVVVSSLEIDDAGEKGIGPAYFDQAIARLRAALRLLRDAGARRFVITADHGFLLAHSAAGAVQGHGRKVDPGRRHVLSPVAADHRHEVRVPLAALGYDGTDLHLMMPQTTALFDTGRRQRVFAHGGNSLQERVIPVLTLEHRAAAGIDATEYAIEARALDPVAGMHCIEARAMAAAQGALDFGGTAEIELALRVPESAVQVDLCQVRGGARLAGTAVLAEVGQRFELFFRLRGPSGDARVPVALVHPTAQVRVIPCTLEERFTVTPGRSPGLAEQTAAGGSDADWLSGFADAAVRRAFAHLAEHGVLTETDAAALLGGARALRRFSAQIDEHARKAPFGVRIDVVAGVKRYVKS